VCERRTGALRQRRRRAKFPARRLLALARTRAKEKGLPCTITAEDVRAVWPADNRCPALGLELVTGRGVLHDASPTLARSDATRGSVPGNIAVLSFAANRIKGPHAAAEIAAVARWLHEQESRQAAEN
jgi:hypothetical protein